MSSLQDQNTLDYYMFDNDKHMFSSQSGKQRTKKEAEQHTNRFDPSGHSRKINEKLRNTEINRKEESCSKSIAVPSNQKKNSDEIDELADI
ncbi:p8 nuclear protein-like protein [Sarcoptes scabiei]|uniref:P8 nuclear protein-like protein n=1 Tax=Sarcoptes scabiei TaxID=52283 RepID=A0A132AJU0_SARSC|nr:p8 nuclear protein-like protein [Sarcoptes scabiei]